MEGLARFAGIQDASDYTSEGGANYAEPPAIPHSSTDIESQTANPGKRRPSRVSLPLSRQSSRKTIREQSPPPPLPTNQTYTASRDSHDSGSAIGAAEDEEEIPWGPAHPCFPHPNPHVPRGSPSYATTRIIRVQRDWLVAGDLYPALANMYPEILADEISEPDFRELVETLNVLLQEAFTPWSGRALVDGVMGVLTGFLWDDAGMTGSKAGARKVETWIERWNWERENEGKEVRLIQLRRTGYLSLDVQIPDPGIDWPDLADEEIRQPEAAHV